MATDPKVTFEDRIRAALAGATTSLRQHLDADLLAFTQEVVRAAGDERQRAATAAAEAAAAEVRAQAEVLVQDVRAQADLQLGQLRAAAQKHAEELKRAAEAQIGELRKALEDLRTQTQQQLETARRTAHAEIEKARGETEKARVEILRLQEEADRAQGEADLSLATADAARAQAKGDVDAAREQAKADVEAARVHANSEIEAARVQANSDIETARAQANAEIGRVRADADAIRSQAANDVEHARKETEVARADADAARGEADAARAEIDGARSQAQAEVERAQAHVKAEAERALAEVEKNRKQSAAEAEEILISRLAAAHTVGERRITDAIDRAHTDSHQSELARASRLVDAFRNLDEARGLSEVLERLVQCAALEVDRAAMLLVKGLRLAGWRLAGFTPNGPPAKSIDLSVEEAGLAGAVLESGTAASKLSDAGEGSGLPPFAAGAGDRHAMALPVRVGGEVVAVLYADAPRFDTPSSAARWPAILEVLARHASRSLEAMTVQQAAGLSLPRPMARGSHSALPGPVEQAGSGDEDTARRYARLLFSEIRMYHEPVVNAGRRSHDLMSRLQGEIERARRLYEARVPETLAARAEYFDQELIRTLAGGDSTVLGDVQ